MRPGRGKHTRRRPRGRAPVTPEPLYRVYEALTDLQVDYAHRYAKTAWYLDDCTLRYSREAQRTRRDRATVAQLQGFRETIDRMICACEVDANALRTMYRTIVDFRFHRQGVAVIEKAIKSLGTALWAFDRA